RRELAPAYVDLIDVRCTVVRVESRGLSRHQPASAYRGDTAALHGAATDDRVRLEVRDGGRAVCVASTARRVRGVGNGAQGCPERRLLDAHHLPLREIR